MPGPLLDAVSRDLTAMTSAGIHPIFVFNGLTPPLPSSPPGAPPKRAGTIPAGDNKKIQRRQEAFEALYNNDKEKAANLFQINEAEVHTLTVIFSFISIVYHKLYYMHC